MQCPTIADLPPPPPDKFGWPWTEACEPLPDLRPDGSCWPRISIVTPSFNQGRYIEETIRSILLQGYPDLEYIIMDGGSTDDSIAKIERYAQWLTAWETGPDGGQTYAIAKGVAQANGSIFNWINSDDRLEPGALETVATSWYQTDLVSGAAQAIIFGEARTVRSGHLNVRQLIDISHGDGFHQSSVWLRLDACKAIGLNHNRQYGFDWELLVRYLNRWPRVVTRDEVLSRLIVHSDSKSGSFGIRFNVDRLATARELLNDHEFAHYRAELKRRIYSERRSVVFGSGDLFDSIRFIAENPRSLSDRFVLGSIRARFLRETRKWTTATDRRNP